MPIPLSSKMTDTRPPFHRAVFSNTATTPQGAKKAAACLGTPPPRRRFSSADRNLIIANSPGLISKRRGRSPFFWSSQGKGIFKGKGACGIKTCRWHVFTRRKTVAQRMGATANRSCWQQRGQDRNPFPLKCPFGYFSGTGKVPPRSVFPRQRQKIHRNAIFSTSPAWPA